MSPFLTTILETFGYRWRERCAFLPVLAIVLAFVMAMAGVTLLVVGSFVQSMTPSQVVFAEPAHRDAFDELSDVHLETSLTAAPPGVPWAEVPADVLQTGRYTIHGSGAPDQRLRQAVGGWLLDTWAMELEPGEAVPDRLLRAPRIVGLEPSGTTGTSSDEDLLEPWGGLVFVASLGCGVLCSYRQRSHVAVQLGLGHRAAAGVAEVLVALLDALVFGVGLGGGLLLLTWIWPVIPFGVIDAAKIVLLTLPCLALGLWGGRWLSPGPWRSCSWRLRWSSRRSSVRSTSRPSGPSWGSRPSLGL